MCWYYFQATLTEKPIDYEASSLRHTKIYMYTLGAVGCTWTEYEHYNGAIKWSQGKPESWTYLLCHVTTFIFLLELVNSVFVFCWLTTLSISIHSTFPHVHQDTSDRVMFTQKTLIIYASKQPEKRRRKRLPQRIVVWNFFEKMF